MIDDTAVRADAGTKPDLPKSEIVNRLLSRKNGATLDELVSATSWQPHSVRAYLSGLRKKGSTIDRSERRDGANAYRLLKNNVAAEPKP